MPQAAHTRAAFLPFGTPREPDIRSPWFREPVLEAAAKLLRHRLYLPAIGEFDAGPEVSWLTDYPAGQTWPDSPVSSLISRAMPGSDIRTVWELSRCQHFPLLGLAWRITRRSDFYEEFRRQVGGWLEANPPGFGPNWMSPMEAAIRSANWLVALDLFDEPFAADTLFRPHVLASLMTHGRFIRANLEIRTTRDGRRVNNNHYFSNLLGLLLLGGAMSADREGRGWWTWSRRRIEPEFLGQIHEEGSDFESSLPYHRLMMEMGILAVLGLPGTGNPAGRKMLPRLHRGLRLLEHAVQPDGSLPQLGDSDDGRALPLAGYFLPRNSRQEMWGRWRRLLFHGGEEIRDPSDACLFGEALAEGRLPLTETDGDASPHFNAYPSAGWFFYRRDGDYLAISAGAVGTSFTGNHKHNDLLSLVYWRQGREILTDPGTGCYRGDPALRDRLRRTNAHNTLGVDGEEQNRLYEAALFGLRPDAFPVLQHWVWDDGTVCFSAGHTGYHRLPGGVTHDRAIVFDEREGVLAIRDRLGSLSAHNGPAHRFSAAFHLPERFAGARLEPMAPPRPAPLPGEGLRSRLGGEFGALRHAVDVVTPAGERVRFQIGSTTPVDLLLEADCISRAYGQTAASSTLRIAGEFRLPATLTVVIRT
jgi:hypothetical protein